MSDSVEHLVEGFKEGLQELPPDFVIHLSAAAAREAGRRAARAAIAPLIWSARLGQTLNTTEVTEHLGVSRQALAKRQTFGSILGLPGRGTTLYPVWQFTPTLDQVRPEVRQILKTFVAETGSLDVYAVAAWMTTASDELNGLSPVDWLLTDDDPQQVYGAARRTAGRLAS
jgi:hypothetical protein